jgi:hypothetical protein
MMSRDRVSQAFVVLACLLLAGCGSSSSTGSTSSAANTAAKPETTAATTEVKAAPPQPERHDPAQEAEDKLNTEIKANNAESQLYAGLGATKAAFKAGNNVTEHEPPAEPAQGTDEDAIETTNSEGRVTKYERIFHFSPPPNNRERLGLVAGVELPGYPAVVRETSACEVWRSPILKRLVGDEYAQATTADESTSVTMEAVSHPTC